MKWRVLALLVMLFTTSGACAIGGYKEKMVVCVPVADLSAHPKPVPKGVYSPALSKDMDGQLSQLLYGERLLTEELEDNPEWLLVSALGQECWVHGQIDCLSGYIKKDQALAVDSFKKYDLIVSAPWIDVHAQKSVDSPIIKQLSMGSLLQCDHCDGDWFCIVLLDHDKYYVKKESVRFLGTTQNMRKELVFLAKKFLGAPYVWGGRSAYSEERVGCITSVDCSVLINLIHKVCSDVTVPRNSHGQFLKSRAIDSGKELLPGDLVFLAKQKKGVLNSRINHVMMYIGNGSLIEATGMPDVKKTRVVTSLERFGLPIEEISSGQLCIDKASSENNIVFFGTFCQ